MAREKITLIQNKISMTCRAWYFPKAQARSYRNGRSPRFGTPPLSAVRSIHRTPMAPISYAYSTGVKTRGPMAPISYAYSMGVKTRGPMAPISYAYSKGVRFRAPMAPLSCADSMGGLTMMMVVRKKEV